MSKAGKAREVAGAERKLTWNTDRVHELRAVLDVIEPDKVGELMLEHCTRLGMAAALVEHIPELWPVERHGTGDVDPILADGQ